MGDPKRIKGIIDDALAKLRAKSGEPTNASQITRLIDDYRKDISNKKVKKAS